MRLPYPTPILQQLQSFLLNPAMLLLHFRAAVVIPSAKLAL